MSTPTVYSSTDTSAPTLTFNSQSTWISVLKACLVNGYGSKPGAGWSVAFEDVPSTSIVLKQGGGNHSYLQLSNPTSAPSITFLTAYSFRNMTSITEGLGQTPPKSVMNYWSFAAAGDYNSSATASWRVFADDKFFIIIVYAQNKAGLGLFPKTIYFFGDFTSNVSGDAYNTILNGYSLHGSSDTGAVCVISNQESFPFSNNFSNTYSAGLSLAGPFYQMSDMPTFSSLVFADHRAIQGQNIIGQGALQYPDAATNKAGLSPILIMENFQGSQTTRGTLNGIFAPLFSTTVPDGTIITGTGDLGGHSFMCINNRTLDAFYPQLFIQTDEWP